MSTFSGITQAHRALTAAQRGMDVTGQNIANANTIGYSRQRVEQSASVLNETGMNSRKFVAGDGVVVTGLSRVGDALATATSRQDSASAKEQDTLAGVWANIENVVGDTGTYGLSKGITDLSAAWNDLGKAGNDTLEATKSIVVNRTQTVVSTLNGMHQQLTAQFANYADQADILTVSANTAAIAVASLNESIRSTLANGANANDLLDQRDQQLNALADLTGARVVQRENGVVDVYVGNAALVNGDRANAITVTRVDASGTQVLTPAAIGEKYVATIGGQAAEPASGSLKGLFDGANKTLLKQRDDLDVFVNTFAAAVNTSSAQDVFTKSGAGATFSAENLTVGVTAATLRADATTGTSQRELAKAVSDALPAVKNLWRTTASNVASNAQSADNRAALASQVSLKSDAAREAVSGVNIDEEMTNLVAYQHAYSAAARVLTSIDQALDTLINRTGLVGR